MKKKTKKIIGLACLILLMVMIQAVGITYAKYIASESGTGQAEIAKWGFQIVKEGEESQNINLASTVNEDTLVDGKIAPGTSGNITIAVDGAGSEVNLDYTIEFKNEKNKPNNLIFNYKGKNYLSLSELIISGNIKYYEENKKDEITVFWSWPYETGNTEDEINLNNEIDTQNAEDITKYTFDIVTTATQSD